MIYIYIYLYSAQFIGLVVTSPVIEVEVASLIPVRLVPQILTGKLQAQLPVCVTTKAKKSQYLSATKLE